MRLGLAVVFLSSWLSVSGCSGGLGPTGQPDVQGETLVDLPAGGDVTFAADMVDGRGADVSDVASPDVGDDDATDVQLPACKPGDGCFLDPCAANQDCLSGWCVDHLGKKVCSMPCQDECPTGWTCQLVAGTAPDVVYICISDNPYCANREPVPEECNGIDDDCDGTVDEETCDDGNECTVDSCDPQKGCLAEPLGGTECKDGNPCTLADHCVQGVCTGAPIVCDDNDPCTDDSCAEEGGCSFVPNQADCDDGDPCTVADECKDGTCTGFPMECACAADSDCAPLEDGNLCNGTLVCDKTSLPWKCIVAPGTVVTCDLPEGLSPACLDAACAPETGKCSVEPANDGFACDDGSPCTLGDICAKGACAAGQPMNCNDGNPCTDDSCDAGQGGCAHAPNQAVCNDGDDCTIGDACAGGICLPGKPLSCDDANACTEDSCTPGVGCSHKPAEGQCNDFNPCTTGDHCSGGLCLPVGALDCDDSNLCTTDSCDPTKGCVHTLTAGPCDDGNACTKNDKCSFGWCGGEVMSCDDGNPCTADSCEAKNGCVHTPQDVPCSDASECTTGDKCVGGQCKGGGNLDCDDGNPCTSDSCDPKSGCIQVLNSAACDDGNACTSNDQCKLGMCVGGSAPDCSDGIACTVDSCDPKKGCIHAPDESSCDDGNPCTDDSCDLVQGCAYKLNKSPCDDGNPCTLNDACNLGACQGSPIGSCDDSNPCTKDSCDAVQGCLHQPVSGACDDGSACTKNDQCSVGKCTGDLVSCDDGVACTTDSCNPATGCIHAPDAAACDDSNSCTDDACDLKIGCVSTPNTLACPGGTCSGGKCVPDCIPACAGKQCGDDGCGGQCGQCGPKEICVAGKCQPEGTIECDDGNSIWWDGCTNDKITEFQINTFTPGQQTRPDAATFANGGWVAVWSSYDQDGNQDGVYGQRYDAQGKPAGDEFQINTYTPSDQAMPSVAAFPDNSFVTAWYSNGQDGSGYGVFGQRFNAAGSKAGGEFKVNTYTSSHQYMPSTATMGSKGFVVTWASNGPDGSGYGIYSQRYDAVGNAVGSEFKANTYWSNSQYWPDVAGFDDGRFVIVWQSDSQDAGGWGVYGQRFDAAGSNEGAEFRVNTYTPSDQSEPSVASFKDGGFVVTWQSYQEDGNEWGVYAQVYKPDGSKKGNPFRVNTYIVSNQLYPHVASHSDGRFVITWQSYNQEGQGYGIYGQRFGLDSKPSGNEFQANTCITYDQNLPCAAVFPNGNYVLMWSSNAQDDSVSGVFAQRYSWDGTLLYH